MGGFDEYGYPHFKISQEFALDGGVSFNTRPKHDKCRRSVHFCLQVLNVSSTLEVKMFCGLCDKMLNFVNFENGGTNIKRGILHFMLNVLPISLLSRVNDTPA